MDTANLLSGIGGAILGAVATLFAYWWQSRSLESDEIRRRKVEIIFRLLSSRYVLSTGYLASSAEVQVFNTALAGYSAYFAKDKDAVAAFDQFVCDKSDANLWRMLQVAAKSAGLDLLTSNIQKVVTVPASVLAVNAVADHSRSSSEESQANGRSI
ncbi:MAG TPA: hypothetical protein VEA77_02930 [Hyphomicrobium sp.]|nr:hypothetical protein [Hyphomicrobium sp.]